MAPRGEVVLQITFGPSKSPLSSSAAAYAREHAEEIAEVTPGVWRALFLLSFEERAYGEASQLLGMVGGWRSTAVEVDGSPVLERLQDGRHRLRISDGDPGEFIA